MKENINPWYTFWGTVILIAFIAMIVLVIKAERDYQKFKKLEIRMK